MDEDILRQTEKMVKPIPIVLFGSDFWNNVFNLEYLADTGMINPEDLKMMKTIDSVDEAFKYITKGIKANEKHFKDKLNQKAPANLFEKYE